MRAPATLVALALLAGGLALALPADASAPVCSSLRDPECDATLCYYERVTGQWHCHFPIDWECLVHRPCWWPGPLP